MNWSASFFAPARMAGWTLRRMTGDVIAANGFRQRSSQWHHYWQQPLRGDMTLRVSLTTTVIHVRVVPRRWSTCGEPLRMPCEWFARGRSTAHAMPPICSRHCARGVYRGFPAHTGGTR